MKHRKTLYTLNIGNYAPEVTELTYPLLKHYAKRIKADFVVITERKFPDWPVVYEKLQVGQLAKERGDDWAFYLDSDTLVHQECIDWTSHMPFDTVAHNGVDNAIVRWDYNDEYFLRDQRRIGSCTWCVLASAWTVEDLWRPLDISLEEAVSRIHPVTSELCGAIHMGDDGKPLKELDEHGKETGRPLFWPNVKSRQSLIDDFTLSRNIARYGLKVKMLLDLQKDVGLPDAAFYWHAYTLPLEEKLRQMKRVLEYWRTGQYLEVHGE